MRDANIGRWLSHHAALDADKTAIEFEGQQISYAQLDRWSDAVASCLHHDHGVTYGDRVAVLALNHPATIALLFACARLGAILVPFNWRLAGEELSFMLADAQAKLLLADANFSDVGQAIAQSCKTEARALEDLDALKMQAQCEPYIECGVMRDPVLIVYTSGTTGRPKGALLDQDALFYNALMSLDMHAMSSVDRVLVVLPLFHVGGLNITLTPALYAGATVLLQPRFDAQTTLQAIASFRPSLLVLVPATISALLAASGWPDADLSCLRMVTTGSSIVPVPLIAAIEARGVPVVQVYGSSETSPIAAYQRPGEGRTHPHATGRVGLHCQIRLTRGDGTTIEDVGEHGEIEVRGPNVTRGYWRRPDDTEASFRAGGWFRTGDIGCFDAEGHLYFQDRLKRMIISGGENIYSAEVERVLNEHPDVSESCVVGLPDERWGEVPAALVVCRGGVVFDEQAVRRHVAGKLARFKVPRHFAPVEQLPRNAMGKVVVDDVRVLAVAKFLRNQLDDCG